MQREYTLFGLSLEITGISMIIAGLANQLDDKKTDTLTPSAMESVFFGISSYLDRIARDLANMEKMSKKS